MNRALVIAIIGAVLLATALIVNFYVDSGEPPRQAETGSPPESPAQVGATPTPRLPAPDVTERPETPSFDIVRVNPDGNAVIAGRAAPGAKVTVEDDGKVIGQVTADQRGEWVLVPGEPMESGARKLGLSAKTEDGRVLPGDSDVVIVVPKKGEGAEGGAPGAREGGVVVLGKPAAEGESDGRSDAAGAGDGQGVLAFTMPKGEAGDPGEAARGPAATHVLQSPGREPEKDRGETALGIDVIDYDEKGRVHIGGTARPGAGLRIYLDNAPLGDARAGPAGRWSFRPPRPLAPGTYSLRVDELRSGGRVARRVEIPFSRAAAIDRLPGIGVVVVQPGNSLWRIARRTYGEGLQYTLIFEANKDQIRDPDLIYPGQVFALPPEPFAN